MQNTKTHQTNIMKTRLFFNMFCTTDTAVTNHGKYQNKNRHLAKHWPHVISEVFIFSSRSHSNVILYHSHYI